AFPRRTGAPGRPPAGPSPVPRSVRAAGRRTAESPARRVRRSPLWSAEASPKSLMGRVEQVRRPEAADLMLLVTVVIWSLNFTVTKYVLNHGFKPLAYGGVRFGAAALLFTGVTYARERSFRVRRPDVLHIVAAAIVGIFLNQVAFVYGTKLTTAATVALVFGTMPILTAL